MMAMLRKPPARCQAMADSFVVSARAGVAAMATSDREARAALGCADIPLNCLFLNQDYVVINKV